MNVISGVKRYIRIFDVISEVYSVLLRRRRMFEYKCSHLSQPLYPNFWSVFPARKVSFGWIFFVILKILQFLTLRYSVDFDHSRLVNSFCDSKNNRNLNCVPFFSSILVVIPCTWKIQIFCSAGSISVRYKLIKLPIIIRFSCDGTSEM